MQSIQATGLKRSANPGPVQVIAVTGGKGGVGKTSVAVNLATALASTGQRVMLLDGDLGLANVDVFLGLSPRHTMAHVLSGERTLEEIIVESPHGVQVVPGASGVAELANLSGGRSPGSGAGVQRAEHARRHADRRHLRGHRAQRRAVHAGGAARAARRVRRAGVDDRRLRARQSHEPQPRRRQVPRARQS